MAVLDAPLRKVSLKLINKFGKSMTLTYKGTVADSYSPTTRKPTASDSTATVKGIIEPVGLVGAPSSGMAGAVLSADMKITIAAKGLTNPPKADDTITVDSTIYQINKVDTIYSGDLAALHILHVGR